MYHVLVTFHHETLIDRNECFSLFLCPLNCVIQHVNINENTVQFIRKCNDTWSLKNVIFIVHYMLRFM